MKYLPVIVIIIIFILLGLFYSYYTPLWTPPDEERHFLYCDYIARYHKLPSFTTDPESNIVGMAYHPPLYYILVSIFCHADHSSLDEMISINDGPGYQTILPPEPDTTPAYNAKAKTAHILRIFSLLISAITLIIIYKIVVLIFSGETALAFSAAFFVSTIPQFIHFSASVSNEPMAVFFSSAYLLSAISFVRNPYRLRNQSILGAVLGGCLLSKSSTLFLIPVTFIVLGIGFYKEWGLFLKSLLTTYGVACCIGGWWFLRNWALYHDVFLIKGLNISHPWLVRTRLLSIDDAKLIFYRAFSSFFGDLGALQISIPDIHLAFYGAFVLISTAGFLRSIVKSKMTIIQPKALLVILVTLLGGFSLFIFTNFNYKGVFLGRYLYTVIAPFAIVFFTGFRSLLPSSRKALFCGLFCIFLLIMNVNFLINILKPGYAATNLVCGAEQIKFNNSTIDISDHTAVEQSFLCAEDKLCAVSVLFSLPHPQMTGDLIFKLHQLNSNEALVNITYPLKKLYDFNRCFFVFPPLQNSANGQFIFSISTSLHDDSEIALWYDNRDYYRAGCMIMDGIPMPSDLYFNAYCFTGERPRSVWEGRTTRVISGDFISIRELQLYFERSKEFRQKTSTYTKIIMQQEALNNRGLPRRER